MTTMIAFTVLAMPLAVSAGRIGRRRWIRRRGVARVRSELSWFQLPPDQPGGRDHVNRS
jgi:hypothetical protein